MESSSLPPEQQAKVKSFNPLVLDRTVIAVPLLKEMKEDLDRIETVKTTHPELVKQFNCAIEFNPDFPGGAVAAFKEVQKMVDVVAKQALKSSSQRLDRVSSDKSDAAKKRHTALKAAIANQKIAPLERGRGYSFATLDAAIIRRLLAANDRLLSKKDPEPQPIRRIYPKRFEIIIDLNLEYPGGRAAARQWVLDNIDRAKELGDVRDAGQELHFEKDRASSQYLFARLEARVIHNLVALDMEAAKALASGIALKKAATEKSPRKKRAVKTAKGATPSGAQAPDPSRCRAIFHIWPDFEVSASINKSVATVKADAAQNSFSAWGAGITWAVMDSGIKDDHPHFEKHKNVDKTSAWHKDFTVDGAGPFEDENGHGTHVAGIIAGEWRVPLDAPKGTRRPLAVSRYLKQGTEDIEYQQTQLDGISGMAPRCKLVSLRVLDENGKGAVSNLIAAIDHVQEINGQGRRLLIHGVNMSLGYNFEPEWFACGQSPLCVEVDRLVKTGVVVVVAAGNTGYGTLKSTIGATSAGMALTINDPGNSDLAITVGSTHRDMPHVYGVSYFSSKGPTGDGRLKPDLVAPGEKIISCAAGNLKKEGAKDQECDYVETSGTSMAAPHVSGVIAAFLSVRTEFVGKAERVKDIFVSTATDLRRDRYFQGSGLVDLMRAIQSV
jgi:subtilisin family serine protease